MITRAYFPISLKKICKQTWPLQKQPFKGIPLNCYVWCQFLYANFDTEISILINDLDLAKRALRRNEVKVGSVAYFMLRCFHSISVRLVRPYGWVFLRGGHKVDKIGSERVRAGQRGSQYKHIKNHLEMRNIFMEINYRFFMYFFMHDFYFFLPLFSF